jgi:hypothetical protein
MEKFYLDTLEQKYPGISEKEGWIDLHFKRGTKEIDDQYFKIEIIKFGMEDKDANDYIQFLNEFNDSVEDFLDGANLFEMLEIRMKYEGFSDKEDELKKLIISGKIEESERILKDTFQMSFEEIEIVIESLKFEIQEDL